MNCFYTESSHPIQKGSLSTPSLNITWNPYLFNYLLKNKTHLVELDVFTMKNLSTELSTEATTLGWTQAAVTSQHCAPLDTKTFLFFAIHVFSKSAERWWHWDKIFRGRQHTSKITFTGRAFLMLIRQRKLTWFFFSSDKSQQESGMDDPCRREQVLSSAKFADLRKELCHTQLSLAVSQTWFL